MENIFPENLSLPVIVQGVLERRHNFLIVQPPSELLFKDKPIWGENQPMADVGSTNRCLKGDA